MENVGDTSNHLSELLRLRQEEEGGGGRRNTVPGRTLGSVLNVDRRSLTNRTLLDIIREDSSSKDKKKTWKTFRDKLRLKRAVAAWTSSVHIPVSDVPIMQPNNNSNCLDNQTMMRRLSSQIPISDPEPESLHRGLSDPTPSFGRRPSLLEQLQAFSSENDNGVEEEQPQTPEEGEGETAEGGGGEGGPVRMSLMSLLAETDRQMGIQGSYGMFDEEDEEEENGGGNGGGGGYNNCCVCMLRHKGAAFIPCGHTFCRLCSRELWVQRGNCPICNGFILEILDIF